MVGHSNQVCSLSVAPRGEWFVSGSWDNSARIWQVGRWETDVELQGHNATVWAVLAFDDDTVITGCADKGIRIYDERGKMRHAFDGKDVVRALTKLPRNHPSGAHFASASNDGCIRLWTIKSDLVAELWGHESFIYSLAVLPTGEIVSSGEDRTVRVWQGSECVQVITLPAISVWSVSVGQDGDIIVGSSDKVARIFTREQERQADSTTVAEFEQSLQSSAVPKQQMNNELNIQDAPGPEFLTQKSGTKEGQSQIIKEDDGSATLYQWSTSQQTWLKIGTVVDSAGSDSKKDHQGKQYDYVFDIDIEDGKPPLKLPYNVTQNPYEAATKFLQDNELPMTYLDETANFIIKNSQGATIGQSSGPPAGGDPWGQESRYRPGEVSQSSYQAPTTTKQPLPQKEYLSIVLGNPSAAMGQITKRNTEYTGTESALSDTELEALSKVVKQLGERNVSGPPSLATSADVETLIQALSKAATQWQPVNNRLAPLDLLRFLAASLKQWPESTDGSDVISAVLGSGIFDPSAFQASSKLIMIAIRLFSNLIYGGGKALVEQRLDSIIDSLKPATSLSQTESGVAIAYTTLYLNVAVLVTNGKTDPDVAAAWGFQVIDELSQLLGALPAINHTSGSNPSGQSTEPAYRALVALGTIIVGLKHQDIQDAARALDVPSIYDQLEAKQYLKEPRFQAVARQIRSVLQ